MDEKSAQFVYLDQNILIYLRDGLIKFSAFEALFDNNVRAVYSSETLREIRGAKGNSQGLLEILRSIKAAHIEPVLDKNNQLSDTAKIRMVDPLDVYEGLSEPAGFPHEIGTGFRDILYKQFGGEEERTAQEILEQDVLKVRDLLNQSLNEVDLDHPDLHRLKESVPLIVDMMRESCNSIANQLDVDPFITVGDLDERPGLGPSELKDIKGGNILEQVWQRLSTLPECIGVDMEEKFLSSLDSAKAESRAARANAIYSFLNYVGYHRDKKMKARGRFLASQSDNIHAGLASYCSLMMSGDTPMLRKIFATYEYLGIGTTLIKFDPETKKFEFFIPE